MIKAESVKAKDFYYIYILLNEFEFNGLELCKAIEKTFVHRGTEYDDIVAFEESSGFKVQDERVGSHWMDIYQII